MSATAVLSIGANIGDADTCVRRLRGVINNFRDSGAEVRCSGVYVTPPWGGVEQEDFYNATLRVTWPQQTTSAQWAEGLLRQCQQLEAGAHRVREVRWGPRTLDVDIVDIEGYASDDPHLTVPHPRAHLRAFVLVPWLEIEPTATLGGHSITELLEALPPAELNAITRMEGVTL